MTAVDLIPFKPEHILEVNLRDDEPVSTRDKDRMVEWAKACANSGPCFSAVEGGKVLCCIGLKIVKEGVAEAWMVLSKEGTGIRYLRPLMFQVSVYMKDLMRDLKLHRIQAWVRSDFPVGARYAEALGFHREGLMRKYDFDQQDCFLYSFVEEDRHGV